MISAVLLLTFGTLAGTWGAAALLQATWISHAPRLAIAAWQALAASVLLSILTAGAALAVGLQGVRGGVARAFNVCAENLKHGYESPGGAVAAVAGLLVIALITIRVVAVGIGGARRDRQERAAQVAALDLVARADVVPGVLVLAHDVPYAFCIGGRRHRLVVTSALLETLSPDELAAVLAHESGHLRQRHHTALLVSRTLFSSLAPTFPAFGHAMPLVRSCVELAADDHARRHVGARSLHSALTTLARGPAPRAALGASATGVEARLARLTCVSGGLVRTHAIVTGSAIAALVAVPLGLVVAPALTMAWQGLCLLR